MAATTKVVNVKTEYIRPPYENLREWMKDERNVYIARRGVVMLPVLPIQTNAEGKIKMARFPPSDSKFANPFKIPKEVAKLHKSSCDTQLSKVYLDIIGKILAEYECMIREKIRTGEITREDLDSLRGKNLGCWCKIPGRDVPCHGDVLLKILNE